MKKVFYSIMVGMAVLMAFPSDLLAKTKEETALVKEISGGLPVYMGNGMTWNRFDIDDNGYVVIGLISQNLPDVSELTDETRSMYHELLVGPNSGYVGLSKKLGRGLRINVYNQQGDLCISETAAPAK